MCVCMYTIICLFTTESLCSLRFIYKDLTSFTTRYIHEKNHDLTETVLPCFPLKYVDRELLISGRANKRKGNFIKTPDCIFKAKS